MIPMQDRHAAAAPTSSFPALLIAALRAWWAERRDRRALDQLSDEQLKDIGYRRIPTDPHYYQRLDS